MGNLINLPKHFGAVVGGLVITVFCLFIQNSSLWFSLLPGDDLTFDSVGPGIWESKPLQVKEGLYYLSVGRLKGNCDVYYNGAKLLSNRANNGLRDQLLLGTSIQIPTQLQVSIRIACEASSGFSATLGDTPVLAPFRAGMLLSLWRATTLLIAGPALSLGLLMALCFIYLTSPSSSNNDRYGSIVCSSVWLFGVSAFFYTVSLAHFPRLFLANYQATYLHVVLRNLFGLSFAVLGSSFCVNRKLIQLSYTVLTIAAIIVGLFRGSYLVSFYKAEFVFFCLLTLLLVKDLFSAEAESSLHTLLRPFSLSWLLLQCVDFLVFFVLKDGENVGPAFLFSLIVGITIISLRESQINDRIHHATQRLLELASSGQPAKVLVEQVAQTLAGQTHYSVINSYIDAFCLGSSELPGQRFIPVTGINEFQEIVFSAGEGMLIRAALERGFPQFEVNTSDRLAYAIVPVGTWAVICMSERSPSRGIVRDQSRKVILNSVDALRAVGEHLVSQISSSSESLKHIRAKLGHGRFETYFGSVFVDVNDYSRLCSKWGQSFADFVSGCYVPSLVRSMVGVAGPEYIRGDEVYFVVIGKEASLDESQTATWAAIRSIASFVRGDGAGLCEASGFSPLEVSIGANVGLGTVIVDDLKIRTSGSFVNEAKRLQEAAGRDGILVGAGVGSGADRGYVVEEVAPLIQKKSLLMARRVHFPGELSSRPDKKLAIVD